MFWLRSEAIGGYLREYFEGDVGGISEELALKGLFSLSEYNALIESEATSGYDFSETKPRELQVCPKVLGSTD